MAAALILPPAEMKEFSQSLFFVPTFLTNVFFWRTSGYFDSAAELKPLLHTWTLAVEEQFYLFFPIAALISWKLFRRQSLSLLILFSCLRPNIALANNPPFRSTCCQLADGSFYSAPSLLGHCLKKSCRGFKAHWPSAAPVWVWP
jgi:peptidoglycan/LPS O-acetylase OafA/YrhL